MARTVEQRIGPRFSLELPMKYRRQGEAAWQHGTTLNVSNEGAEFIAKETFATGTRLEVEISMTADRLHPAKVLAVSEVMWQRSVAGGLSTGIHHVEREMKKIESAGSGG